MAQLDGIKQPQMSIKRLPISSISLYNTIYVLIENVFQGRHGYFAQHSDSMYKGYKYLHRIFFQEKNSLFFMFIKNQRNSFKLNFQLASLSFSTSSCFSGVIIPCLLPSPFLVLGTTYSTVWTTLEKIWSTIGQQSNSLGSPPTP